MKTNIKRPARLTVLGSRAAFLALSLLFATAAGVSCATPAKDAEIDYLTAPFSSERILDWGNRPDWSNDGRRIAFTKDDLSDGPAYEIDIATKKVRCLTCALGKNQFVTRIFYLPDDSFLIEASPGMAGSGGGSTNVMKTELFWMSKSLDRAVPLGTGAMGDIAIAPSANADKSVDIAWARPKANGLQLVVGKLKIDGAATKFGDIRELYAYQPGQAGDPTFPEAYEFIDGGRAVMFWTVEVNALNGEMYKVDLHSGAVSKVYATLSHNETHLFPNEKYGLEESNLSSDPSGPYRGVSGLVPGGVEMILQTKGVQNAQELARANSDKGFDIFVITMDGAARRALTNVSPSGAQAHQSVVSPDGKKIAYAIKGPKTGVSQYPVGLYVGTFGK